MGGWNADTQSWDEEPGWFLRFRERIFRTPNVQRNRSLGWRLWFKKYGGFSRPFPNRGEAEAAKKRIMAGEDIKAEFWGPKPTPTPAPQPSLVGRTRATNKQGSSDFTVDNTSDNPIVLEDVRFNKRGPFYRVSSNLPGLFHRRSGHALVLREPREVRFFGDPDIAQRGLSINGYGVSAIETWNDGWHGYFQDDVDVSMVAKTRQPE